MPRPRADTARAIAATRVDPPKPSAWGQRASPVGVLAISATTVAALDLSTKQIAAFVLGTEGNVSVPLFHHAIRLTVILNDRSAFGISLGPYTWHINLVLTTVALLLCLSLCRPLAVIDGWAPLMLGLIAGAATGNLVSLISSPPGRPRLHRGAHWTWPGAGLQPRRRRGPDWCRAPHPHDRSRSAGPSQRSVGPLRRARRVEAQTGERRRKRKSLKQAVGGWCLLLLSAFLLSRRERFA